MASEDTRKLADLRVVDLRFELEKRDLDKSGNKQALIERLQKAMEGEGLVPEAHVFEVDKKPTKRYYATLGQTESYVYHKYDDDEDFEGASRKEDVEKNANQDIDNYRERQCVVVVPPEEVLSDAIMINLDYRDTLHDEEVYKHAAKQTGTTDQKNEAEDSAEKNPAKAVKTEENQTIGGFRGSSSSKIPFTFTKKMSENRNLWITNISQNTRATELKQILAAHGKVIGAKVVINAKYPGSCCYGYVTLETVKDAENCIAKLNNTEFNGQIICVEKVRPDHMIAARMGPQSKPDDVPVEQLSAIVETTTKSEKENSDGKVTNQNQSEDAGKKTASVVNDTIRKPRNINNRTYRLSSNRKSRSADRKGLEPKTNSKPRSDNSLLTFDKIKGERERQRLREKERMLREENRRRHKEATRQREVDRQQRLEATRLERERAKLRLEREKLEKDKDDIIRLERDRSNLEREKLELEKLELERVRLRLQEEDRRSIKRPSSHSYRREESYDDRKHARQYGDSTRFVSPRDTKVARYAEREREHSPHYQRADRDKRQIPEVRGSTHDDRYSQEKDSQHFDLNSSSTNTWGHAGDSPSKVFSSHPSSGGTMKSWGSNANRWSPSNTSRSVPSVGFTTNVGMPHAVAPIAPPVNNFVGDRFEFKGMSNIRKY